MEAFNHMLLSSVEVKAHLLSLFQLAQIDSQYKIEEQQFLYDLAARYGVSKSELDTLMQESNTHEVVPDSLTKKIIHLYNYILMMLVDGKLDDREARMCMLIAKRMELPEKLVGSMSNAISSNVDEGHDLKLTEEELNLYKNYTKELI